MLQVQNINVWTVKIRYIKIQTFWLHIQQTSILLPFVLCFNMLPELLYSNNNYNNYVLFFISCEKKLFDEAWHQLRLLVTEEDVTLYVDDLEIETLSLEPPVGIFINGKTQVGKYVSKETTVPVSLSWSLTFMLFSKTIIQWNCFLCAVELSNRTHPAMKLRNRE